MLPRDLLTATKYIDNKKEKVKEMLQYSEKCGRLEVDLGPPKTHDMISSCDHPSISSNALGKGTCARCGAELFYR